MLTLDKVAEHLKNREYEKASQAGYQEVAHNFIFLQRTLGGLQTAEYRKQSFISEIAMAAKAAYEEVAPQVENRIGFSAFDQTLTEARGAFSDLAPEAVHDIIG